MADSFEKFQASLISPIENIEIADYSTSDHTFTTLPRAIWCDGTGMLSATVGGTTVAMTIPGSMWLPLRASAIKTTTSGLTAVHGWS